MQTPVMDVGASRKRKRREPLRWLARGDARTGHQTAVMSKNQLRQRVQHSVGETNEQKLSDALTIQHAFADDGARDLQRLGQRRIDVRRYHAGAAQRRRHCAEPLQSLRRDADPLRRRQRAAANGKLGRQAQQDVELEFEPLKFMNQSGRFVLESIVDTHIVQRGLRDQELMVVGIHAGKGRPLPSMGNQEVAESARVR